MNELLEKLQSLHGLTAEQSQGILGTITGYIKEKFPMVAGAIDNLLPSGGASSTATAAQSAGTASNSEGGSILDKISDFIPGGAGQKIEDFAKDKLGGIFGEKPAGNS
ncbi:MAG: hypothetical protein JSS98_16205 [Bacteroidetes bacterium]|nr:hypothetical protein [Bacteroidota bacterium]